MVTTFTGILVLVMLTLMMFFAIRVGIFEQRTSANDARQKLAFHAAEAGIHHAKEFFLPNAVLTASYEVDKLPDGTDGWLSTDGLRWQKCSEAGLDLVDGSGTHPCFGESVVNQRANSYYYSFNDSTQLPLTTNDLMPGGSEAVTVEALLCVMNLVEEDEVPVKGCSTDPDVADGTYYMLTLLARGAADCDNGANCGAEALVSEKVSSHGAIGNGNAPSVPLITRSTFPPSGSAEIVPNPNSGGVGVPVSVWMNGNTSCGTGGSVIDPSSGSWATCEMHEWYGVDATPDNVACTGNCSCTLEESISYTHGQEDILGIDLVQDPAFPCDLFQFYFGVPKIDYQVVKSTAKLIDDCSVLGPNSSGIYWITGLECQINSNTQVGSPKAPVFLITAAKTTILNGGANIFGVMYVTDVEESTAQLQSIGTNTVYGSVIIDATLGQYNGTFQVVWNENSALGASQGGGLGSVVGGWSDFHEDWN
jgi:hypothetical protein